jgi:hypothetical protein
MTYREIYDHALSLLRESRDTAENMSSGIVLLGKSLCEIIEKKKEADNMCDAEKDRLLSASDPQTAKPMTATRAEAFVSASSAGILLKSLSADRDCVETMIRCLRDHHASLLRHEPCRRPLTPPNA